MHSGIAVSSEKALKLSSAAALAKSSQACFGVDAATVVVDSAALAERAKNKDAIISFMMISSCDWFSETIPLGAEESVNY
jgi:hypothetical protein